MSTWLGGWDGVGQRDLLAVDQEVHARRELVGDLRVGIHRQGKEAKLNLKMKAIAMAAQRYTTCIMIRGSTPARIKAFHDNKV